MSASNELQAAIYNALTADMPLMAVVSGVYDAVPDNESAFPYVTIGEDVLTQFDTDDTTGYMASITVHVWSRELGRKEAKTIQGLIYNILHNSPLIIGDVTLSLDFINEVYGTTEYKMLLLRQESENTLLDPDGKTRHGVQTFESIMVRNA